jgi:hypothetical protein
LKTSISHGVPQVDQAVTAVTLDRGPANTGSETWLRGEFEDGAVVPGNRTLAIDGTPATWIPFPASAGGGQLAPEQHDEILEVSLNAAASTNPERTAQSVMVLIIKSRAK